MCGFYCITFIEYISCLDYVKNLLDYINFFSPNNKKNDTRILKINMVEEASLEFRFRKINETINYL